MKDMESVLKLLVTALIAAVALAAFLTGRTAVQSHYEYQAQMAPRTLHQMVMEMEADEEPDGRGPVMLFGAGLLAIALLVFGGFAVYAHQRTALLREERLGRRKARRPTRPQIPSVPMILSAPTLGDERPRPDVRRLTDGDPQ